MSDGRKGRQPFGGCTSRRSLDPRSPVACHPDGGWRPARSSQDLQRALNRLLSGATLHPLAALSQERAEVQYWEESATCRCGVAGTAAVGRAPGIRGLARLEGRRAGGPRPGHLPAREARPAGPRPTCRHGRSDGGHQLLGPGLARSSAADPLALACRRLSSRWPQIAARPAGAARRHRPADLRLFCVLMMGLLMFGKGRPHA